MLKPLGLTIVIFAQFFLASNALAAGEFPAKGRIFAGVISAKNDNINTVLDTEGLNKIDNMPQYGLEITYKLISILDVGLRYEKHAAIVFEKGSTGTTTNNAGLGQDVVLGVARLNLANLGIVRFDAYAGVGGASTHFEITSVGQTGELTNAESGFFSSMVASYGASVGVGYKWIYLTFEAGMQHNKVDAFKKREGNVSTTIQGVDLSGPYASIGLLFDGITATSK